MKYTLILILFAITNSFSNSNFKNGLLIDPNTNKPFTGTIEVINKNWNVNSNIEITRQYYKGVPNGQQRSYYESGVLKSVGKFNRGLLDSDFTTYYENGNVKSISQFIFGVMDSRFTIYHPKGGRQLTWHYDDEKLEGVLKTYYENGNLMREVMFKDGLLHGYSKTYYENNGVFEDIKYNYGTPKIMIRYREDRTTLQKILLYLVKTFY